MGLVFRVRCVCTCVWMRKFNCGVVCIVCTCVDVRLLNKATCSHRFPLASKERHTNLLKTQTHTRTLCWLDPFCANTRIQCIQTHTDGRGKVAWCRAAGWEDGSEREGSDWNEGFFFFLEKQPQIASLKLHRKQIYNNTRTSVWTFGWGIPGLRFSYASIHLIRIIFEESFFKFGTRCTCSKMNWSDFGGQRLKFSVSEKGLEGAASNLARVFTRRIQMFMVHFPKLKVCWWVETYDREVIFGVLVF